MVGQHDQQLESLPTWSSTAIIINWDDSDGWYDQVMPPIVSPSNDAANDVLNGNHCGTGNFAPRRRGQVWLRPADPDNGDLSIRKRQLRRQHTPRPDIDTKFVENNWNLGSIGPASFDNLAGSLDGMFNFNQASKNRHTLPQPA